MKVWRVFKNLMLSSTVTMLYAIWCKENLKAESTFTMWLILISVFLIFFMLLRSIDKEIRRMEKERMLKSITFRKLEERRKKNEKTSESSKRTQSTKRTV